MVEENVQVSNDRGYIDPKRKNQFTSAEWKCYALIENFRDKKVLIYSSNRKLYLDALRERPILQYFLSANEK